MRRSIVLDGNLFAYELVYKDIKNINMRIKRDGSIRVSAPEGTSQEEINSFLSAKSNYIIGHMRKINSLIATQPKAVKYESGDVIRFMGFPMTIMVREGPINKVHSYGFDIFVDTRNVNDDVKIRRMIDRWLEKRASDMFTIILQHLYVKFGFKNTPCPEIKIKKDQSVLGVCNPARSEININLKLAEAPPECIEYVIARELCHLVYKKKTREFYEMLEEVIPDWEERNRKLDDYMNLTSNN